MHFLASDTSYNFPILKLSEIQIEIELLEDQVINNEKFQSYKFITNLSVFPKLKFSFLLVLLRQYILS